MQVAHTKPQTDAETSTQPCARAVDICMQSMKKKTKTALHSAHLQAWSDILAGHISSCTSLVKIPTWPLDQNWLPASQSKAQVEKFKSISICSIRDTLQQLLSPKEQGKPALQFFPAIITPWKRLSWRKITKLRTSALQQSPCINPANKEVTL